jgi:hypothetical protein
MRNQLILWCVVTGAMAPAWGQESLRRATLTGDRGDRGKCTIEIVVDQMAEVQVSGDSGRLRTLRGQPAEWRRFQCSDAIPRRPADFRFRGIDGRGRVELVRDPRENRGVAVVRIQDTKGGREGYTFDLEWRGSDSGAWDRDGDRGRRGGAYTVTCSSDNMRRNYCQAEVRGGVRLVRQLSQAPCRQNYSWGYDRRGIWVDRGCRADFEVAR